MGKYRDFPYSLLPRGFRFNKKNPCNSQCLVMYKPMKLKYSVKIHIIPRLWVLEEIRNYNETQIIDRVWVMYNFILSEYYGKDKYISILWVLTKNLLNQKIHTIPRYGKLVPIDFLMYGNFFFQFMKRKIRIPISFPIMHFERFFLYYTLAHLKKLKMVSF